MRLASFLTFVAFASPVVAQDTPLAKIAEVGTVGGDVTRTFFGHVVAKQTVDFAFQVGGELTQFPVIEGQTIGQGDLVAQLDLEPYQLALDQAELQKAQAQRTVDRLQQLRGSTVSQVSVDDAQTALDLADVAVRNAQRSLNNATLKAPFEALVASRNVANFTTVAAGTPVVRLHDMSEIRIDINVPEVLFQRAGRNNDVSIIARFPSSSETFPLEVREFNADASAVGQSYQLTFGMTPPDGLTILPGSSVTVEATISGAAEGIAIPSASIVTQNDGTPTVLVFTPNGADEGTVSLREIAITPNAKGQVLVTSGLEPGEEIIASGAAYLEDGATVRRFTGFPN